MVHIILCEPFLQPISIRSLPTTRNHHEDRDSRTLVHRIITYDYNNPDHDNVTCVVVTNEEPTLLELTHNGNFSYDCKYFSNLCQFVSTCSKVYTVTFKQPHLRSASIIV